MNEEEYNKELLETITGNSIHELMEERYYVGTAMKDYAGSFFKCIGEALFHAHPSNVRIIKKTWRDEWDRYLRMGKTHEKHKDNPNIGVKDRIKELMEIDEETYQALIKNRLEWEELMKKVKKVKI